MGDFIIDADTREATLTREALKQHVERYVRDVGLRVPTLYKTKLTPLLSNPTFSIFGYLGSLVTIRAHIRTALIHNLRNHIGGTFPTWRIIGVDALLANIFEKDAEDAETLDHDILFLVSPDPCTSDKIQAILVRLISGRSLKGLTTVLCTKDLGKWFERTYSPEFKDMTVDAPEASQSKTPPSLVRSWNTCTPEELR